MKSKRITKTQGNSRRTTTYSDSRKTESYSNRPSKGSSRRTVSFNHKTGKTRTTYTTKLGGGWANIQSSVTNNIKMIKTKPMTISIPFSLILLCIAMYVWPILIPVVLGIALIIFLLRHIVWVAIILGVAWGIYWVLFSGAL